MITGFSFKCQLKHLLNDWRMLIRDQMMPVIRILLVSIRGKSARILSVKSFCPERGSDLLAAILRIPLVDDILERCKFVITLFAVDIVIDGDETNLVFRKDDFRIISCFQIVSADSG